MKDNIFALELKLISYIKQKSNLKHLDKHLVHGIGDDCAVIDIQGEKLLITTDSMVQDVHFRLKWSPPYLLGKKAASSSISDIAAMGAIPKWALLNLCIPKSISQEFISDFIDGFLERLDEYKTTLIGGDITSSPSTLTISVTIIGTSLGNRYLLRKKDFSKGDLIFCSGYLGEAAAGLLILENKKPKIKKLLKKAYKRCKKRLINAFLDPKALVDIGLSLSSKELDCALMDISDGIATDLCHMLKDSGFCAKIYLDKLPISRAVKTIAKIFRISPYDLALKGGEDYQLLWILEPNKAKKIIPELSRLFNYPISLIGYIDYGQGIWVKRQNRWQEVSYTGFEHKF